MAEDWSVPVKDVAELHPHRQRLVKLLERRSVEMFISGCILLNLFLLILESDASVDDDDVPVWVTAMNYVLLSVYIIELLLRLIAYRCNFFLDRWNILDLAVISSDLILLGLDLAIGNMPKVTILRACRLVRLVRAFKALSMFPELALLLSGFVSAVTAIFWGMCLILIAIVIWAILAVQLIHPVNKEVTESGYYERSGCERCPHAFESVFKASLTIFQTLVAGDSWGALAVPIIERSPLAGLFFLFALVTVSYAITNLMLAVVVERATSKKEESRAQVAENRQSKLKQSVAELEDMYQTLDRDKSGILTEEELLRGFELKGFAECMQINGLGVQDIRILFNALDEDNSGGILYEEFVSHLIRLNNPDLHLIMMELLTLKNRHSEMKQIVINSYAGCAKIMQSCGSSPQTNGSHSEGLVESCEARAEEFGAHAHQKLSNLHVADAVSTASPIQHGGVSTVSQEASQHHRDGPHEGQFTSDPQEKALHELAAAVRDLVSHSELQINVLAKIESALSTSLSGKRLSKSELGSFRQLPLACMPRQQSLSPPEPPKPQLTDNEKSDTLPHTAGDFAGRRRRDVHCHEKQLNPQAPRVTTPRSSLEARRKLLSIPPKSARCHTPMHTPRDSTPLN